MTKEDKKSLFLEYLSEATFNAYAHGLNDGLLKAYGHKDDETTPCHHSCFKLTADAEAFGAKQWKSDIAVALLFDKDFESVEDLENCVRLEQERQADDRTDPLERMFLL